MNITRESFFRDLENGVRLCQLAKAVSDGEGPDGPNKIPPPDKYKPRATPGIYFPRLHAQLRALAFQKERSEETMPFWAFSPPPFFLFPSSHLFFSVLLLLLVALTCAGTFHARDNVAAFLHWVRGYDIDNAVLFEVPDLVDRKNELHVLYWYRKQSVENEQCVAQG